MLTASLPASCLHIPRGSPWQHAPHTPSSWASPLCAGLHLTDQPSEPHDLSPEEKQAAVLAAEVGVEGLGRQTLKSLLYSCPSVRSASMAEGRARVSLRAKEHPGPGQASQLPRCDHNHGWSLNYMRQ